MSELLTQAEYAKRRGCSKVAVHKAVKAGRISLTDDGKIDPVKADAQWSANSRARAGSEPSAAPAPQAPLPPAAKNPIEPAEVPTYQESRARREAAEAELAEIKLQQLLGTLIDAAAVKAEWAKQVAAVREGLLNIPARLAPVLAAEADVSKVQASLDAELRNVLAQFVGEAV